MPAASDPTPTRRRLAALARSAAALALLLGAGIACAAVDPTKLPGEDAPSAIQIVADSEPGTPLLVEGTVFAPDGVTPAPGVVVYVYQTGIDGLYAPAGEAVPRLRGWMRTDARGRYSYRTIRPGPYPGRTIAAHVHTQLWGGGYEPQWNRELLFDDDPYVGAEERRASAAAGRFAWVCVPKSDGHGLLRCRHDLRLKPGGDRFEAGIRHGLDAPPAR